MGRSARVTRRSLGTISTIEGKRQSSSSISRSAVSGRYVTKSARRSDKK